MVGALLVGRPEEARLDDPLHNRQRGSVGSASASAAEQARDPAHDACRRLGLRAQVAVEGGQPPAGRARVHPARPVALEKPRLKRVSQPHTDRRLSEYMIVL
jgi:hypothetical protein